MDTTPLNNLIGMPSKELDRFIAKIDRNGPNGCWIWMASRRPEGYGQFRWGPQGKAPERAHRLCYQLSVGPIPEGWHLHHKCENPPCVNPQHLEPVSPKEHTVNITAGSWAYANAHKTHCPNGHEYNEENTGQRKGRRFCKACIKVRAEKFRHPRTPKTHCIHGHALSGDNVFHYKTPRGTPGRGCKACYAIRDTQRRKRLIAERGPLPPKPELTHCRRGHPYEPKDVKDGVHYCRKCARILERARYVAHPRIKKTHCINGHLLAEGNLYPRKNGGKMCRQCAIDRARAKAKKRRPKLGATG